MPLEKGNKIYIDANDLVAKEITAQWSQNFSARSQQYYVCAFVNKDQGDDSSLIFIQKSRLDQFKSLSGDGNYTITVDDSFQYGQTDRAGANRWLVFHEKNQKLYQHRLMHAAIIKYKEWIGKTFGNKFPLMLVPEAVLLGEFLKDF